MTTIIEMHCADIGVENARVTAWLKDVGDSIVQGDPLLSVESDKAQIDIPSTYSGILQEKHVAIGDVVSLDHLLCTFALEAQDTVTHQEATRQHVTLPDIGLPSVKIVGLWVADGADITEGMPLLGLESDKAQIDVPSPFTGTAWQWSVAVGDMVECGDVIGSLIVSTQIVSPAPSVAPAVDDAAHEEYAASPSYDIAGIKRYASPLVRKVARLKGLDVDAVTPTGMHQRVTIEDITAQKNHVTPAARRMSYEHDIATHALQGTGRRHHIMKHDIDKHIQQKKDQRTWQLTTIQQKSAAHVYKSWSTIPHVTHGDEVVVTALEQLRQDIKKKHQLKMSLLPCVLRAIAEALEEHPKCATRLSADGSTLHYTPQTGINIAVDTKDGLLTPRLDNILDMSLPMLIDALEHTSEKMHAGQTGGGVLLPGAITVTSLGGVGGRWFTPIINAPQIAIVGVMKGYWAPLWQDDMWINAYMLPLVLSYDHRALDGAQAQHFLNAISRRLAVMHEHPWMQL